MQPSPLARYLCTAYALLIIYASLHPFSGWRDNGVLPFAFLAAAPPRYVTTFDVVANLLAYAPFGFLAVLALFPTLRGAGAVTAACLAATALSVSLEFVQNYLPARFASNLDVAANAAGALVGAIAGAALSGKLLRDAGLHALRYRLFRPGGRIDLGLVLIGLWLVSQLSPGTLLFGTGDLRELLQSPSGALHTPDVFMRVEAGVAGANTVAVGLLAAALVERGQPVRLLVIALLAAAFAVRTFAFGLLFSAQDMLAWVTPGAVFGVAAGTLLTIIASALPLAARLALSAVALMAATALVNLAPGNPYLTASLAVWQQGHFLNFNGLTRIVSAIWPFCALLVLMLLAGDREHRGS
jgi:VanZ family protein